MKIAIVKYNAGNIKSVVFALQRHGLDPMLTDDREELQSADKVIFPGQGEASSAMRYLKANGLDQVIKDLKQPVLGICVGLQLMCRHSEEGNVDCLNIFDLDVKKFPPKDKVPHMGWNTTHDLQGPLFKGIKEGAYLYYVHSYYAEVGKGTIATNDYINPFSAAIARDNFYALQAHLEKSGPVGEQVMENFIQL